MPPRERDLDLAHAEEHGGDHQASNNARPTWQHRLVTPVQPRHILEGERRRVPRAGPMPRLVLATACRNADANPSDHVCPARMCNSWARDSSPPTCSPRPSRLLPPQRGPSLTTPLPTLPPGRLGGTGSRAARPALASGSARPHFAPPGSWAPRRPCVRACPVLPKAPGPPAPASTSLPRAKRAEATKRASASPPTPSP